MHLRVSNLVSLVPALATVAQAASYDGPLRPQVHFSPPVGFMNDPNGLFLDAEGTYHLYYQYNPSAPVAANQHWGHATSHDLYHWANQPVAIGGDKPNEHIFSGAAVVDVNNTSGFFPNQTNGVVAIYTLNDEVKETQNLAYSTDGGFTFTKYASNPIIDSAVDDFRDPQVIWHPETQKWILSVAYAHDRVIGFYTSTNLKEWVHASNFTQLGLPGTEFECPNIVKFSVGPSEFKEVLFISVNPGAPLGGSGTFYVVGNFNGTHFISETPSEKLYDFAKDNYASQWWSGIPAGQDPVSIGWASNWEYCQEVPSGTLEGWRSANSVPRVNTLTKVDGDWTVTTNPFMGLSSVLGGQLAQKSIQSGNVVVDFSKVKSNAITFDIEIEGIPSSAATGEVSFNITSSQSGEYLDGALDIGTGVFWISRAGTRAFHTTNNKDFTPLFSTTVSPSANGRFMFSGIVDRSVFETFLDHGKQIGTMSFFPNSPLDTLSISASGLGGATAHVNVRALKSGWNDN
ncbi:hypothetical protein ASPWEDRAFT_119923 [Aspergillus wentii DTO 134E9]|uniref:Glycosyl hydrolase family 32 N-terminal domain-containing protein n=1 Tax=Aspergillus wentii DTO 134E9 TaxID=1073089 RepID=A0A1L9R8X2_ASPWE|nr:uncharacterized protein ASPWEDRAFT_119923 [Aspergillus wentii DTO 134E9]OJJ31328.1 hypothetical protein ASPWEDRAFT_119923 [Aspergillus wentii DTO 134E9]